MGKAEETPHESRKHCCPGVNDQENASVYFPATVCFPQLSHSKPVVRVLSRAPRTEDESAARPMQQAIMTLSKAIALASLLNQSYCIRLFT